MNTVIEALRPEGRLSDLCELRHELSCKSNGNSGPLLQLLLAETLGPLLGNLPPELTDEERLEFGTFADEVSLSAEELTKGLGAIGTFLAIVTTSGSMSLSFQSAFQTFAHATCSISVFPLCI